MVEPVQDFWSAGFFGDVISPVMILLTWHLTAPFQAWGAYPGPEIKIHAANEIVMVFH